MDTSVKFKGQVSAALVEVDPSDGSCSRIVLKFIDFGWVELTGVELSGGFLLPEPLGCACCISDISARQLESAKYEIEFQSSYSRDGAFFAREVKAVQHV